MTARKPTPEGVVSKDIVDYLTLCRLGKVRRVNAGVAKVGNAPTHPWQKDTRYRVQLAEPGHSDLVVELERETRCIFIEVKAPKGKATDLQLAFLARQRTRGNVAFVAHSVLEVYEELTKAGFRALPVPQTPRTTLKATTRTSTPRSGTLAAEIGSQNRGKQ